jgi:hypothetical protein
MANFHQILAFLTTFGVISVLHLSAITRTFGHLGNSTSLLVLNNGNTSTSVLQSSSTSASAPETLPLWKDKLRSSEAFTGFRYVTHLQKNVPMKVGWSSNKNMYDSWIKLPLPANNNTEAALVKIFFRFSVIRDPLERLYSGYYNKCIMSPDYENHCIGWSPRMRKAKPPTLLQFLQRNYRTGFLVMHRNPHYKPITQLFPDLDKMDHVFHMGDANFNRDIAHMWKRLGGNHTKVDRIFPVHTPRKRFEYESRTTHETIQQHFADCETLHLGLLATQGDYHGKFAARYFPTPQWALDKLNKCGDEGTPQKLVAQTVFKNATETMAAKKVRDSNQKSSTQKSGGNATATSH